MLSMIFKEFEMIVDINEIEKCLRYFKAINSADIDDIVWMRGEERMLPDTEVLNEYKYTGLSNRDFPSICGWFPDDIGIRVTVMKISSK
jgi:hypothetical protein